MTFIVARFFPRRYTGVMAPPERPCAGAQPGANQKHRKEGTMQRTLLQALLGVLLLMTAATAAATDMQVTGDFDVAAHWLDNTDFLDTEGADDASEDDFSVFQRMRLFFDFTAGENLKAVLGLEAGTSDWGVAAEGAGLDTDGTVVEVKHAYLDFTWPGTGLDFRVGLQPLTLPGNMGSPVFDWDVAGILANYQFSDTVGATFGWIRPFNNNQGEDARDLAGADAIDSGDDELDALALLVPVTGDGFTLIPWAAYAMVGENASGNAAAANDANAVFAYSGLVANSTADQGGSLDAWWVGAAFTLDMLEPFLFSADLVYGSVDGANATDRRGAGERAGWYLDAMLDYKMDAVTPALFFVYATGEDDDLTNGSERMPTLGGGITPTSFGFNGAATIVTDTGDAVLSADGTNGLWLIGGALKNFSFVEGLEHTVRAAYGQGTTDEDFVRKGFAEANGNYLTTKDSFWELNLDSAYAIYENLSAFVEMGYLSLDLDEDVWNGRSHNWGTADVARMEDAWKLALALQYRF